MSLRPLYEGAYERWVLDLLKRVFVGGGDFTVVPEVAKYRPAESINTWEQVNGRVAKVVEVYAKDIGFVCDVDETMKEGEIINKVKRIYVSKWAKQQKEVKQ